MRKPGHEKVGPGLGHARFQVAVVLTPDTSDKFTEF